MDNPAATPRSAPPTTQPSQTVPAVSSPSNGAPTDSQAPPTPPDGDQPVGSDAGGAAPASQPPATATTIVSSRPTTEDVALLAFAQSFELTARDLYQTAITAGAGGDYAHVFATVMENHEEYGNVIAGLIGTDAPQRRDDAMYDQFVSGFDNSDTTAVAKAGYDLESTAVATHSELIGQLTAVDGATTLAALLVIESRHCTVLAHIAGNGDDMAALIDNTATALRPTAPAEG